MEETAEIAPAIKNGVGSSTSTLSANNSTSTDSHKSGGVRIDLEAITQENVGELRHLNLAIFPVRYHDKFYREVIHTPTQFTRFAYRGRGIGSALLRMALDNLSLFPNVCEVYLHVQSSNEDAINFYERFGFVRGELVKGYYKRIEPPDCYVLRLPCNQQQPQQKHS